VDERSLRALLARGEREQGGGRRRSAAVFWALAGAIPTGLAYWLGVPLARAAFGFPRVLALGSAAAFGVLALYCWLRLLGSLSRK
jgi:hypothetical protein